MYLTVFAESLPDWFRAHAQHLESDPSYRVDFHMAVKKMPTKAWERAPKWRMTARFKKMCFPECEQCGAQENLEVHHKTYDRVGLEILHLDDLSVLCRRCHQYLHDRQFSLLPTTTNHANSHWHDCVTVRPSISG